MIYINLKDPYPLVYIPSNNAWDGEAALTLALVNSVDKIRVEPRVASQVRQGYLISLTLGDLDGLHAGEWEYTLEAGATKIATGLCKAYDGQRPKAVEYKNENKVIQYGN